MEFNHSFDVAAPVDHVWRILLDFERIAPCVPGAQLTSVSGDEYSGSIKVRLGPITAQYRGTAELTEVDEAERRIVVVAKARDTHGQGNVGATLVGRIEPKDGGSHVVIDTNLQITGKVAQLGRGVMQEVSAKLLQQFVSNLNRDVLSVTPPVDPKTEAASREPANSDVAVDAPCPSPAPRPSDAGDSTGQPRLIHSEEVEAIDLISLGGAAVGRKLIIGAVLAGITVVLIYLWLSNGGG
ncbi:hypothetical protein GCM10011494_38480 [Novosphingobium endophyticum]|uniref:Carbon monoxide dehydrogenase n=1 Tax=Novosphingobium endophyticum TaxID=1955250 RepID=A0A916TYG1_9SPHN|nr:SRPBCC family protein [Novosphingobium endophyticum]GGC15897.1 hypothetical protein GCM10011494_38480 [Novosphingobium endophyticum]